MTPAALRALLDGDIEAQEARGQIEFVESQTLPIDCPREDLEALGFVFVFGDPADDIFVNVTFPEGWTKEATDHSMWSDLKDASGNVRGNIFYKAAFYDRGAHMNLTTCISYSQIYTKGDQNESFVQYHAFKRTGGESITLFETERSDVEKYSDEYFEHNDKHADFVRRWVEENYPDYNDVTAYWD